MISETHKILIADPDQRSVVMLSDALKERGYSVLFALDGPRTLDIAISEVPDLIILEHTIPLIDVDMVTSILRANPRTGKIPIIFASPDRSDILALQSYHDSYIPKPYKIDESLARVDSMFQRENKVREVSTVAKEIEGNLTQIPIVDLLQVLCMHKKEGAIALERYGEKGYIHLKDGNVINAEIGKVEGEKALFRLFTWQEGKFEFSPHKVLTAVKIRGTPDILLMEGMRQIDEWERLREKFPHPDSTIRIKVNLTQLPQGLRPITQKLLLLLEFYTRVSDIVDNCPFPDYECYMTLQALIEKGIIEEIRHGKKGRPSPKKAIMTPEKILKLKELFSPPGRSRLGMAYIRTLVFSPSTSVLKNFLSTLRSLPGLTIHGGLIDGRKRNEPPPFGIIAKSQLSETLELHFLSIPFAEEFSPLWRVFSTRSIGAILICDAILESHFGDFRAIKTIMREGRKKGIIYVFLGEDEASEKQKLLLQKAMRLGVDEAVYTLSRGHPESASSMLTEMLEMVLS